VHLNDVTVSKITLNLKIRLRFRLWSDLSFQIRQNPALVGLKKIQYSPIYYWLLCTVFSSLLSC